MLSAKIAVPSRTLVSGSVELRGRVARDLQLAGELPAGRGQHLHQADGVGRRADHRIERGLLRGERGDEERIEPARGRVLLQQRPVVQREHHLLDLDRQRLAASRQPLRVGALHRVDAEAQVAHPVVDEGDGGDEGRRIAPHALGVLQLVQRFAVEADGNQLPDPPRGGERRRRRRRILPRELRHHRALLAAPPVACAPAGRSSC